MDAAPRRPRGRARARIGLSTASVYPKPTAAAFELAGQARLRRRRGHGLDRPGQPGPDALQRLSRALRRADPGHPRAVPGHHPAGLDHRPVGEAAARPSSRPSCCGAQTVVVHPPFRWQREYARDFRRRHRADGRRDRRPVRGREHVPAAGARPGGVGLRAVLGRRRRRAATATTPWTCRTPRCRSPTRWPCCDAMGERLAHLHIADGTGAGQGRAPGPRPRHPAVRRGAGAAGRARLRRARHRRGQHPPRRSTGPSARPTWPRRWPSAGCTWSPRPSRAGGH